MVAEAEGARQLGLLGLGRRALLDVPLGCCECLGLHIEHPREGRPRRFVIGKVAVVFLEVREGPVLGGSQVGVGERGVAQGEARQRVRYFAAVPLVLLLLDELLDRLELRGDRKLVVLLIILRLLLLLPIAYHNHFCC